MRPLSDINIGDQYKKGDYPFDLVWRVEEIDREEKLIKLQAHSFRTIKKTGRELWKKNTDRLFNRRIFNGLTNKVEL